MEDTNMKIQSVFDDAFRTYGRVVDSYDYSLLLERLEANTPKPADSVVYVPSVAELEDTPAYAQLRDNCYGGMPIEIGYCNGTNTKLNCFEYHRDSEIDIAADDAVTDFPPFKHFLFLYKHLSDDGKTLMVILGISE